MSLRVLHVLFGYYPDPIGGTEVYVEALSRHQKNSGLQVAIAAPASQDASYQHNAIDVFRFALDPAHDLDDLYGEGDRRGAEALEKIAKDFHADVVHFHAFTRGVSLLAAKKVRAAGAALVVTYHTPTVSCARGTMMRMGQNPCSGSLQAEPCVACTLASKGLSSLAAHGLSRIPPALSDYGKYLPNSSMTTALRMPALLKLRQDACVELLHLADHWVGVCDWVCDVLKNNGVDDKKISLSRQGVSRRLPVENKKKQMSIGPLRAVMLGRLDASKGWHIVLEALSRLPDLDIRIDAYAVNQTEASEYVGKLKQQANAESRFSWCEPLPSEKMLSRLTDYDVLLVPSQLFETGPLVVLEAFEARLPVIGSALGGIAELVQHENTGFLVSPYNNVDAWADALKMAVNEQARVEGWRRKISSPRGMQEACDDMMEVYRLAIEHRAGNALQ